MSNYLSDKGYLAIGLQASSSVAVTPSIFVPLLEEDMSVDPKIERVKQIVGIDWTSNKMLQGEREQGGSITILADPDNLGHFLNMTLAKGSSSGSAGAGYTHPFTVDETKYYTIDILRGNSVHRYVGCRIDKLEMSFENSYLKIKADIVAKNHFSAGTLKTALTGAGMTSVVFDEAFDVEPCLGLVAGDTIQVWSSGVPTDVVVATVAANKKSITMTSTTITATAGDLITLKAQTPSYPTILRPFKFGQCLVGFGADTTAADAASANYTLATPVDEWKLTINRNIEQRRATGKNDPILLSGLGDAEFTTKRLFENSELQQKFLDITKKAVTIVFTGDNIATTYYASLTIKLHNIKPKKNENKLKKGEYIYDETTFNVEYDNTDAKAIEVSIVNTTAGASL